MKEVTGLDVRYVFWHLPLASVYAYEAVWFGLKGIDIVPYAPEMKIEDFAVTE